MSRLFRALKALSLAPILGLFAFTALAAVRPAAAEAAAGPRNAQARTRVLHAATDAPAVDVYAARNVGGFAKAISGLTYPNAIGYLALNPGFYRFAVAASTSSSAVGAVFKTPWRLLLPGSTYTAWAIGTLVNTFSVLLTADAGIARFAH